MPPKKTPRSPPPKPEPVARPIVPLGSFQKIVKLQVESGFLNDLALDFAPGLNCIIGERGTGKTTVLELLRFALKGGAEPKRQKGLIKENLGSGVVRVTIETKEGRRLLVERQGGAEAASLFMQDGTPADFTLDQGLLFDCEVFGQDEIETIASTPAQQLALLDRFAHEEIARLQAALRDVTSALQGNAHEILTLEERCQALDQDAASLPELREKLAALEESRRSTEGLDTLDREVALKGQRDGEARAIEQARRFLDARRDDVARVRASLAHGAHLAPSGALTGPNAKPMAALQGLVDGVRADFERALGQALTSVESATRQLDPLAANLAKDHLLQDAAYREQVTKHEAERVRSTERVDLLKRVNAASVQERAAEQAGDQLAALQRRRKELVQDMDRLRKERYSVRSQEAARLTKELGPRIKVEVRGEGDNSAYEALLSEALEGHKPNLATLARSISERVPARDLVRIVRSEQTDALAGHTKLARRRAEEVVRHLATRGRHLHDLEAVEIGDVPIITLLDEDTPKELSTLSTGQKCTTVLPILLLEETKPLLIDQPEDNLDNRYIFEVVVEKLRTIKRRRQLIFVTHNANIPVLGDAEHVVVMKSTGRQARVLAAGTVDKVKAHVETILEGGPEAFEARRKRYGR